MLDRRQPHDQNLDVTMERGGSFHGYWKDNRVVVTRVQEIPQSMATKHSFSFYTSYIDTSALIGFWHTHDTSRRLSLADIYAYWQLRRLYQKRLLFGVFVYIDRSFHALEWKPSRLLPSFISTDQIDLPISLDWLFVT